MEATAGEDALVVVVVDLLVLGVVMVDDLILIMTNSIVSIVEGIIILERLVRI